MKKWIILLCAFLLVFSMGANVFAQKLKLRAKRIDLKDLPQKTFEITRYVTTRELLAIVLDRPDDDVLITASKRTATQRERVKTPQGLEKEFFYHPVVYRFQSKGGERVFGYLLIARNYNWLANFNKSRDRIIVRFLGRSDDYP